MKYIKAVGLAALAMALMAFVGAGTASATTLDNGEGQHINIGTSIDASLVGSAELKSTGGSVLDTCTSGTVEGVTTTTGGINETVKGTVTPGNLTWGGCTATTDTLGGGELEIHWIAKSRDGTVTGTTFEVTVEIASISCVYGLSKTDSMVHLGTLTGSDTTPILEINTPVVKRSGGFLCPETTTWKATYHVTSPTGLTVTE